MDDDTEAEEMEAFFEHVRSAPGIARIGDVYVDIEHTVNRLVACSDGLCMQSQGPGRPRTSGCCNSFDVPLDRDDVERVSRVVEEVRKIRDVDRAIERADGWWRHDEEGLWLEKRPSGACVFLSAPKGESPRCTIHEWALEQGHDFRDHKPATCCIYPLYTAELDDEILVTSYGSPLMLRLEPDQADQLKFFACTAPPAGVGRSILIEMHDELCYRVGSDRWLPMVEHLVSEGRLPAALLGR